MTNFAKFGNLITENLNSLFVKIYKKYGGGADKMLIHTGVIGWVMSSAAQIFAILLNDKIPKEQKMFLIPQEFADAVVNILSFYTVTMTFTSVASKLVKTGKWRTKTLENYLKKHNLMNKVGKKDFNIFKDIKLPYRQKRDATLFDVGIGVLATAVGSVLSCNIITPLLRNLYASKRQKTSIQYMNRKKEIENTGELQKPKYYYKRPTMADMLQYNSSLKI